MNWGIISTANIANRRCNEIRKNNGVLHSISSRNLATASDFKKKNNIKFISKNYNELIENKEINFVYIPTPSIIRFNLINKSCSMNKNILAEKPVCNNLNEMLQIKKMVENTGVLFLDATDFLYNPKLLNFKNDIKNYDNVEFKFYLEKDNNFLKNNIRTNKNLEPLGCLGDIGWYAIRWAIFLYPQKIVEVKIIDKKYLNEVISDIKAVIIFENNKFFSFDCSFTKKKTQELIIKNQNRILLKTNDIFKLSDTKYRDDVFKNSRLIEFFTRNINRNFVNKNLDELIKTYEIIERIQ